MNWFKPRYPVLKRVIVNTRTGNAFRGLLWAKKADYLVLRQAEMLGEAATRTPMDGEVVIERSNVDFMQVLP